MIKSKKSSGFTLIELLVTIAILGILTTIGINSYLGYTKKSKRADAMHSVLAIQMAEEKDNLTVKANFPIALADYSISRPEILFLKLAKVMEITLELNLSAPLSKPEGSMTSR